MGHALSQPGRSRGEVVARELTRDQGVMPMSFGASSGRSQQEGRSYSATHRYFDSTGCCRLGTTSPDSSAIPDSLESSDAPADDGLPSAETRHIEMKL
jgi:hypothetical protein